MHLAGELGIDESVHGAFRAFGEWKELSTPRLALLMRLAAEQGYTSTMLRIQDIERSELQGLRARVLGSLMRQIDPTEMPESDPHRERSAIAGMPAGIVRWVRIQVRDQDAVRTLADAWADSRALTMDRSLRAQGAAATSPAAVTHHAQLAVAADAIAWRLFVEIGPWFLEDLVVGIDGDRRLHGHAIVDCDFERCAAAWQALGGTGRLVLRDGHRVGFAGTLDPWVVRLGIDDEVLRSIAAESKDPLQPIAEPALADGDAVRIGFADHRTPAPGDLRAFALVLGSGASDATVDFASATEAAAERLREPLLSGGTWRALRDPMPGWLRETGASAVTSGRAPLRFLLLALVDLEARQH